MELIVKAEWKSPHEWNPEYQELEIAGLSAWAEDHGDVWGWGVRNPGGSVYQNSWVESPDQAKAAAEAAIRKYFADKEA